MTISDSPDSDYYVYINTPTTSLSPAERDSVLEVDEIDAILTPTLSLSEAEAEDSSEDEMPPLISEAVLDKLQRIREQTLAMDPENPDNKISSSYTCSCSECSKKKSATTSEFGYARNKKDTESTKPFSSPPPMAVYMSPKDRQRYESTTTNVSNTSKRNKTEPQDTKPKGIKLAVKELYNSISPRVREILLNTVCLIYFLFMLYACYLVGLKAAAKPPALPNDFDYRVGLGVEKALLHRRWDHFKEQFDMTLRASMDTPEPQNVPIDNSAFSSTKVTIASILKDYDEREQKRQVCDAWNSIAPEMRMDMVQYGEADAFKICWQPCDFS